MVGEGEDTGADLRAALEASCLRGALPPVDLQAVRYKHRLVHVYLKGIKELNEWKRVTLIRAIEKCKTDEKS